MKKYTFFLFFIILVSIIPSASAIGLRGLNLLDHVDFEPGLSKTYTYSINANSPHTQDYEVNVTGEFAEYITLSQNFFEDVEQWGDAGFTATLKLPQTEPVSPGKYRNRITAYETYKDPASGVGTKLASTALIVIRVLYDGIYPTARLTTDGGNENETIEFALLIENWGKENITSTSSTITIYDSSKTQIDTASTSTGVIETGGSENLQVDWDSTGNGAGLYFAKAKVNAVTKTADSKEINFTIGTKSVEVTDYTKTVEEKKINKFEIDVKSNWAGTTGVFAKVNIDGINFETPTKELEGFGEATLLGYFDASKREVGTYSGNIQLDFDGQLSNFPIEVEILESTDEEKGGFEFNMWYVAIAIIVVLVAIIIYMFSKRKPLQPQYKPYGNTI